MTQAACRRALNGVDVPTLFATLDAVKTAPEIADFQFRARNTWVSGAHSRTVIQGFYGAGQEDTTRTEPFTYDADHPTVLVGGGHAPTPVEFLLRRIDAFAERSGIATETGPAEPDGAVRAHGALAELDLRRAGYRSVIWATGFRRSYPWLHVPVLDDDGDIRHLNGNTASPGLHVIGMRWQTRRSSTFLDGVRHDAAIVVAKVLKDLHGQRTRVGSAA
jgi:hypothetical protein